MHVDRAPVYETNEASQVDVGETVMVYSAPVWTTL